MPVGKKFVKICKNTCLEDIWVFMPGKKYACLNVYMISTCANNCWYMEKSYWNGRYQTSIGITSTDRRFSESKRVMNN